MTIRERRIGHPASSRLSAANVSARARSESEDLTAQLLTPYTKPYTPQGKGCIERLFRALKHDAAVAGTLSADHSCKRGRVAGHGLPSGKSARPRA